MDRFIEKVWEHCPQCGGQRLTVFKGVYLRCNNYKCQWTGQTYAYLANKFSVTTRQCVRFLNEYQALINSEYRPAVNKMHSCYSAFARVIDDYDMLIPHIQMKKLEGNNYVKHLANTYELPSQLVNNVLKLDVKHLTAVQWADVLREMRRNGNGGYFTFAA